MSVQDIVKNAKPKMQSAFEHLLDEFKQIRTGRASTAMVEDVKVSVYEQEMPLKSIAQVSTPDAKSLSITPWDQSNMGAIEKAIREDKSLGLNPLNDGKTIHINVPPLTGERREQMIKLMNEKVEQTHISMRNARHEALNDVKKAKDSGSLSEDDMRWAQKELDKMIDEFRTQIESASTEKRTEITQV